MSATRVSRPSASRVKSTDALTASAAILGHTHLADNKRMPMAELSFAWLDTTLGDIRYALRSLAPEPRLRHHNDPALTLGLGASLAVFTAADNLLVRPLPYRDASRLVMVWEAERGKGYDRNVVSPLTTSIGRRRTMSSIASPLSRRSARCSPINAVLRNFGNRA